MYDLNHCKTAPEYVAYYMRQDWVEKLVKTRLTLDCFKILETNRPTLYNDAITLFHNPHILNSNGTVHNISHSFHINLALYNRDCVSLCLSEETLKAVGPFYLVAMPGEVKYPTSPHWKCVTCRGLHILAYRRTTLSTTRELAQTWAVWGIHN